MKNLSQKWDLERLYPGGSDSRELQGDISGLRSYLLKLEQQVADADDFADAEFFFALTLDMQEISDLLLQISSFVACLMAENVKDTKARIIWGAITELGAQYEVLLTKFDARVLEIECKQWERLVGGKPLESISFWLNERRHLAKAKMKPEQEVLVSDLEVDGFHAWNQLYDEVAGNLEIVVNDEGHEKTISIGQASNLLSDSDDGCGKRSFPNTKPRLQRKPRYLPRH